MNLLHPLNLKWTLMFSCPSHFNKVGLFKFAQLLLELAPQNKLVK
jgi:hypothetical protein